MMTDIEKLKTEIEKIKERNRRVETEKAWEVSSVRKLTVLVLTYVTMSIVFSVIRVEKPLINAIIPTTGYFLSTLSIRWIKQWWINNRMNK